MGSQTGSTGGDAPREISQPHPTVIYDGKSYEITREGTAEILDLQRLETKKGTSRSQSVFYNPIQQYNRDLSVLAIRVFGDDFNAVRRAKQQRKKEQGLKGGQRGKKRKRDRRDEAKNAELSGVNSEGQENAEDREKKRYEGRDTEAGVSEQDDRPDERPTLSADYRDELLDSVAIEATSIEPEETPTNDSHDTKGTVNTSDGIPTATPTFRILDALSATGLRALRYAREIPFVTAVTANDLSASATTSIELNARHNKLTEKIVPTTGDAVEHMQGERYRGSYQVIDLDPYGTAAPFLDAAVLALADGGMLCVTCTDAGVFASLGYLEKTYSQYGGLPLKGPHAHEGGLRLILHAIATSAARYGIAIEPLLSLSIDFYVRVFVRIHRSAAEVKFLASKTMLVYSCDSGCGAWSTQHLARSNKKETRNGDAFYTFSPAVAPPAGIHCEQCGTKTHQAGPMWGGPLHNNHFIQRILDLLPSLDRATYGTVPRIEGMLSTALSETIHDPPSTSSARKTPNPSRSVPSVDPAIRSHHPFFFLPSSLSKVLHCVSPSDAIIRGALRQLGYRTTRSHTKAGSIGTDAPWSVIWEIMREWVRQKSPIKEGAIKERTAGWGIMQKDRSRLGLEAAKETLKQVLENPGIKDISELKRNIESALPKVSEQEPAPSEETSDEWSEAAMGASPNSGDIGKECQQGIKKPDEAEVGLKPAPTPKVETSSTNVPPSKLRIVFDEGIGGKAAGKRMVRYQTNPRADWGPMNRAKGHP